MMRIIADKEQSQEEKEKVLVKKKEVKVEEKTKPKEQLTAKNYFKVNPNFKFNAYVNDLPIKEMTIKKQGVQGLIDFVNEAIFEIKNRKAPVVVARMEGNTLSVNPNPPIVRDIASNITPRGYLLGVINELRNLKIKVNDFISLYDYSKGKLNKTVEQILEKKVVTQNYNIVKIDGVEKLSDVIGTLNSSKKLQTEMEVILRSYNNYVNIYGRYLLNLIKSKFED